MVRSSWSFWFPDSTSSPSSFLSKRNFSVLTCMFAGVGCMAKDGVWSSRRMGCTSSIPISYIVGKRRKKPCRIHEVAVFVPALRIPLAVDLVRPLRGLVSRDVSDKLSTLRGWIVSLAEETCKNLELNCVLHMIYVFSFLLLIEIFVRSCFCAYCFRTPASSWRVCACSTWFDQERYDLSHAFVLFLLNYGFKMYFVIGTR